MRIDVGAGTWRIGSKLSDGKSIDDLIHVRVWPLFENDQTKAGQWVGLCAPSAPAKLSRLLVAFCCRQGLLPVCFAPDLEDQLRRENPLCLVADTNALYQGSLFQALRLRSGKPTIAFVPDQVFMEVQRRREHQPISKPPAQLEALDSVDMLIAAARRQLPVVASRALSRIRSEVGVLVNQARPPDAMVRYFGSDSGSSSDDEGTEAQVVAPNFQRDRLILEVVRHVRNQVPPDVPVWFLTADAALADQAACEGFHAGFVWLPDPPSPFVVGSPHIEPRSGRPSFQSFESVAEELLWNLRTITVQAEGASTRLEFRLPSPRDQVLGRCGVSWGAGWRGQSSTTMWSLFPVDTTDGELTSAPRKAPGAESLVRSLIESADLDGVLSGAVFEPVRPYLSALGWARENDGRFLATERGKSLADAWRPLRREDVDGLLSWQREAATDLMHLRPVSEMMEALAGRSAVPTKLLSEVSGWSKAQVDAQARLLSAFGIAVRIDGLHWPCSPHDTASLAATVRSTVKAMEADGEAVGGAVQVDLLYRRILATDPPSIHEFRAAVFRLQQDGVLVGGGSAPTVGTEKAVRVSVLMPDPSKYVVSESVDLGAGDFLIPGMSSQTVRLVDVP